MKKSGAITSNLQALRLERGLTQEQLAQKLQVSRQTIISIEANRYSPSLTLAFQIAHVLHVDIHDVFQFTPSTCCTNGSIN